MRNCYCFPALFAMLLAAGCSSGGSHVKPDTELPEAHARIADIRQSRNREPESPMDDLEEVLVPVQEAWLDRAVVARYSRLPAASAFQLIAQGRPVRFDFPLVAVPQVIWSPEAATIREHLDSIARQADWTYQVEGGVVHVMDIETRNFSLSSQPGVVTAGLGLRNLNASGGSTADNSMGLELDPYAGEILDNVRNTLGARTGGEAIDPRTDVTISPSANLLVVTAKPGAMRKVEKLLDRYNSTVRSMIRITLSLIEVDFSDEEQRDLALNVIRSGGDGLLSLLLGSASRDGTQSTTGIGGLAGGFVTDPDNRHLLSSAVFEWLDRFGDSSITFDDTFEVLNNHVASVDLTRTEQYVSKITREPIEGSNRLSTEVEIDNLRTGLVMHLQPTVDGDRIVLRLGLSRSALVGRTPYTSSSAEGETLTTDDFNRNFSIALLDGRPRLLSSLSRSETRNGRSRIPFFGRFGIGTSRSRESRKKEVVMLITADLIDGA